MTNEQFERLTQMVESNNFDDILLAVELMKTQLWQDPLDKNFRLPKRYVPLVMSIVKRCFVGFLVKKIPRTPLEQFQYICNHLEPHRTQFEWLQSIKAR